MIKQEKNPSPLNNLDLILESTHNEIIAVCDSIEKNKKELGDLQELANCTMGLALLLSKIKYRLTNEKNKKLHSQLIFHEFIESENGVGWEECLQYHIQRMLKPDEEEPKVLKTTKKLKSLLSTLLDQDLNKLEI